MKTAIILFVSTPLLGQAGLSLEPNAEQALRLYSIYIEELLAQFRDQKMFDIYFCCEEKYQAVLISNHFSPPKNCLVYSGNLGQRMKEITHYCGDYQGYNFIYICPQEFTFVTPTVINDYNKKLSRTRRSVLLDSSSDAYIDVIGLNFPFHAIFEDIIWQKDDIVSQIKDNLKQQAIPCIRQSSELVLRANAQYSEQMSSAYPRTCAILKNQIN